MLITTTIENIQSTLQTSGVYRSSTFVLKGINAGLKLTGFLTLYDERRVSLSSTGSRNIVSLPSSGSAHMLAPMYVANSASGNRVNPVRVLDFELAGDDWEGTINGADSAYYIVMSPVHELESELLCSPMQNTGTVTLDLVGCFVPQDVASGDSIDFPEQYGEALYFYGLFYCYVSMPGKAQECLEAYKNYIAVINLYTEDNASRFPSDQGIKPVPVEFKYDLINRRDMDGLGAQSSEESRVTQGA